MGQIKIEFFHDAICSYCFVMAYRMRQLQKLRPDIQWIHRVYEVREELHHAQGTDAMPEALEKLAKSRQEMNQMDELHRFNIEGIKTQKFVYPLSLNNLLASRAAEFVGGQDAHWDSFDAMQNALFVHNQDISDTDIIKSIHKKLGIDYDKWLSAFGSQETKDSVYADFAIVRKHQLPFVPYMIINDTVHIDGTKPLQDIVNRIGLL